MNKRLYSRSLIGQQVLSYWP